MENISKDIRRKIALELSPHDLIKFCLAEKKLNEEICNSKDFWRQKLIRDYPLVFTYYQKNNLILKNPKNTYIRKFTEITKEVEKFINKIVNNKFLNKNPKMYDDLIETYYLFKNTDSNKIKDEVVEKFMNKYELKYVGNEITKLFWILDLKDQLYSN